MKRGSTSSRPLEHDFSLGIFVLRGARGSPSVFSRLKVQCSLTESSRLLQSLAYFEI